MEQDLEYDEKDRSNYEAILKDYQTGSIKIPKPGFGYFYYAGHRVTEEVELAIFPLSSHFDEWTDKYGWDGRSWFEQVVILTRGILEWLADLVFIKGYEDVIRMYAASTSMRPSNQEAHHMI
jgi:hypothetical protein